MNTSTTSKRKAIAAAVCAAIGVAGFACGAKPMRAEGPESTTVELAPVASSSCAIARRSTPDSDPDPVRPTAPTAESGADSFGVPDDSAGNFGITGVITFGSGPSVFGAGSSWSGSFSVSGSVGFSFGSGPPRIAGQTRLGTPAVNGRLPPEVVSRVVRQNTSRLTRCYESSLQSNPKLADELTIRFVIGKDGSVLAVSTTRSTFADAQVQDCVSRALRSLTFPAPDAGIVTVSYPMTFGPAKQRP